MKTYYWSIGPTDLILCQSHLALFAIRPASLPHSDWEAIAAEIKTWCAARYKIVEIRNSGIEGNAITLNVTGNANPDTVLQALKTHLQNCFQPIT